MLDRSIADVRMINHRLRFRLLHILTSQELFIERIQITAIPSKDVKHRVDGLNKTLEDKTLRYFSYGNLFHPQDPKRLRATSDIDSF